MSPEPRRSGCLTAWLAFMALANLVAVFFNLGRSTVLGKQFAEGMTWPFLTLGALAVLNLGFVVALFKWRRFGFYGIVVTGLAAVGINIWLGLGVLSSLTSGMAGILVLFGVLRWTGTPNGWSRLR